ncbi:MAG: ChaN family lipoprotein [Desulforhopalus sp.]|nr:ChaN family lipoprotein [Desulforhopalus sp.]
MKRSVLLITALFILTALALPLRAAESAVADYELSLTFTPGEQSGKLSGTAKLTILPGQRLILSFPRMTVTSAQLRDETGLASEIPDLSDVLILPASSSKRWLTLSYSKTVEGEEDNLISHSGISLNTDWHPLPDQPMRFKLTASLPDRFKAITESDTFPLAEKGNTVQSVYQKPVTAIHFAAGPYTIHKRQVRENLFVYSLFFPEDAELADGYLQAAAEYLNRYEREIGPYPYNHYAIVANRLPTGYGIPTFTLLGQTVLRLPFIKATSLGHEIVHSWFGNAVQVDPASGNWCEGLTAFLADHAYREEAGEGIADRNETITRYLSYAGQDGAILLRSFASASHTQTMAEAKRAVGYNRGSLFFYELREKIGSQAFTAGLRHFYATYRDRSAGWDDLRTSFAAVAKFDLHTFFNERLERADIPALAVENIEVAAASKGSTLSFTLRQTTDKPFTLDLPIRIKTPGGEITVQKEISELITEISIGLDQRPLEFTIDPDHAFSRRLAAEEFPPVWSRFLGSEKKLAILAGESDRAQFQPLLDSFAGKGLTVTTAEKVGNKDLRDKDLLFLGTDQAPARSLFGPPPPASAAGLIVDVRRNPLSPGHVAVLITSRDPQTTPSVIGRLSHYGKYSYLEFTGGRNTVKRIQPVQSGLRFVLEELPRGGATAPLAAFPRIIDQLATQQVVYVGETHTNFADHLLQLRIIEALYKKNPLLAIGMEMFPASAQPALDRYILGEEMDEKSFLKESGYYQAWNYDYRFFRDIVNFARSRKIPIIGLNLDRQITTEVFRSGGTDDLSPEILGSLPKDRVLDMPGYAERLAQVHDMHVEGKHGTGAASGFLQAQALWDETMAANIAEYIKIHPERRIVVLAGTQHTRKDSGIPPRLARQVPVRQASVVNLYNNGAPADLDQVADYFFLATLQDLPESPKIGIVLDSLQKDGRFYLKISEISPHGKAAAAGLAVGDIIKEINGTAVTDRTDLYIAMLDCRKGDTIPITIIRGAGDTGQELALTVELTVPPRQLPPNHP